MRQLTFLFSALMMVSMVVFSGCGSKEPARPAKFANAPEWVLNPQTEEGLAAVGSAQKSPGGMQFQRTEAMANARDELARILSVKVNNMTKNFMQSTGVGDAQTFEKVASQVSKQVASQTLEGSRQKDVWIAEDGELYILVTLDPATVKEYTKEAMRTSMKNEEALWQQFQAQKADQQLDAEIEKMLQ